MLDSLPFEVSSSILSMLPLRDFFRLQQVSKPIYFFFWEKIFPVKLPYFNFEDENIKYLHLAILFNKVTIVKWLFQHQIWNPDKRVLLGRYKRSLDPHRKILIESYQDDITLAISLNSHWKITKFLMDNGVQPMCCRRYWGMEEYLMEKEDNYRTLCYYNKTFKRYLNHLHLTYNYYITDYQYTCFTIAIMRYKREKRWFYYELMR